MANNLIQVKRTSTSGRTPNTTNSGNNQYITAGELALNMADGILYTSNGSVLIAIGANNKNVNITGNLTVNAIIANGSVGTAGYALFSNGSSTYWASPAAGSVDQAAQYNWTNTQTFTNTITFSSTINGTANNALYLGGKAEAALNVNNALTANNADYLGTVAAANYVQNTDSRTLSGNLVFSGANTTFNNKVTINGQLNANDVTIAGNLIVTGTTTTINATTLDVKDLNITIAKGAASAAAADGSGITVDGANALITYTNATDSWNFNKYIVVGNASVNATINSTAFTGSANNTTYVNGKTESNLNVNNALTSNNSTYAFGKTEGNLNVNNALTANASTYLNGKTESNLNVNSSLTSNSATYLGSKTESQLNVNSALTSNNTTYVNGKTESNLNVNNALTANNSSYLNSKTESNLNVNNALTANSTTYVLANSGIVSNSSGVFVNSAYIATLSANNTTYVNGKTESNLNVNSAVNANSANNSSYLGGVAAANYVQNTDSRTLSGNLVISGTYFNPSSNVILLGNSTQRWILSANSGDFSSTVNAVTSVNSALLSVGTSFIANTSGAYHTGVVNAASLTTTGITANIIGIYPTSNSSGQNLGTSTQRWVFYANTIDATGAASITNTLSAGNTSVTGFVNATVSVNSALLSVGANFTANATLVNAAAINVVNQVNTATLFASTSANVGANVQVNTTAVMVSSNSTVNTIITPTSFTQANTTATPFVANVTGLYHTGTINAASHTIGSTLIANTLGVYHTGIVNAASHTTSGVTANVTGVYPVSNSTGSALGLTAQRWTIFANSLDTSGNVTANGITINGDVTVGGNVVVSGGVVTLLGNSTTFTDNMLYLNQGITTTVTGASGNGTYVTFTANNNYQVNWSVTVTGVNPSGYNGTYTIFSANATHFIVPSTFTTAYVSGGTAIGKTTANPDLGLTAGYNDGTYRHTGIFRDASDGYWKVFDSYTPEPDASVFIDTSNNTFKLADFWSNSLNIGNTSVYSTINSTAFSGSANNTTYVNGKTEGNLNVNSAVNANSANNSSYLGGVLAANYVQNTDSRTLSGNLVISGTYFNPSANTILLGNSIQRWVISANSGDFSSTVNAVTSVNSALLSVGTAFTANATLVNAAALNVVNQINTATLYTTTTANVGSLVQVNTTAYYVASNSTVNTVITATSFTQANTTATPFVANVTGLYHTGVVNAASHTIGSTLIANTLGLYHTGTINAASLTTTGITANVTGVYPTSNTSGQNLGTTTQRWILTAQSGDFSTTVNAVTSVNSALLSVGASFTANATLVNAAAINVVNQTNTATLFVSTTANVGSNVSISTSGITLGSILRDSFANTTTGTTSQIIDYWAIASYRSAKYTLSVKDNNANAFQLSEMLVLYDTANPQTTEYGIIVSNSSLGVFSANSNTTHVRLTFTPTSTNTTVKADRLLIAV